MKTMINGVKIVLFLLACYLVYQQQLFAQMKAGLAQIGMGYWWAGQGLFLMSMLILTLRWKILLGVFHIEHEGFLQLLIRYYQALFFNTLIPGAITGDVIRGYQQDSSSIKLQYVVIFLERVIGLFSLLLLYV